MKKLVVVTCVALALVAVATASTVRLTGYGATRKAWAAHHRADSNPKLDRGCCYLPKQADGQDRYYQVQRDEHGRVYIYSMHFAPKVSARFAKALLRRHELPADARLVRSKRKAECLILQYRSAAAKRAVGSAVVGAGLYSNVAGKYTGRVQDVNVIVGMTTSLGC